MEKTITFIAEHKKRECEQVKEETEGGSSDPQDQQAEFDPEPNTAE